MLARWTKWIAVAAAAGGFAVAGCSSNPPCLTDLTEVDAARKEAAAAEQRLETLSAQRDRLENEIAAEQGARDDLERRKAELEAEIAALGGGR